MKKGCTAQEVTAVPRSGCRFLLLMLTLLVTLSAWGAGEVLVIGDTSRPYFRSFTDSLAASLERNHVDVKTIDTDKLDSVTLNGGKFQCVVTVGNQAARLVSARQVQSPILHALVTESFAHDLYQATNGQPLRSFLLIDQPVSRLILLAHTAMPDRHKLGVLYGPSSVRYRGEVRIQAARADLQLVEKEIQNPDQLGDVISFFRGNDNILLTLPDPVVVNESTAKTLILGAYLENLPLVGYSQALVKAGALMSVYSTPDQLGTQGGELISTSFWNDPARRGALIYPRYYQVSVNYQVAHALQIDLPSENVLTQRLGKLEEIR